MCISDSFLSIIFKMISANVVRNILYMSGRAVVSRCALPVVGHRYRQFSISKSTQMSKIYTKTGDTGTSAMFTGERRPKDDIVFEALGTVDELSATIGLAADYLSETHKPVEGASAVGDRAILLARLEKVQCCLQDIGSHVATVPSSKANDRLVAKVQFDGSLVEELEEWIDEYTGRLPPLRNFIIPGGSQAASAIHVARSVCRRAERRLVPLLEHNLDESVYKYLNRLSDFFFTISRSVAQDAGKPERIYRKPAHYEHKK